MAALPQAASSRWRRDPGGPGAVLITFVSLANLTNIGKAATDDAWLIERAGGAVRVVSSPPENFKVTTPADLRMAELIITSR